jgi:hypothetical protein
MTTQRGVRVGLVLTIGGVVTAVALAALLVVFGNLDAGQPVTTDLSMTRVFWMSVLFAFFTVPLSWGLGLPTYHLLRRFGLLRVWVCLATGALLGIAGGYGLFVSRSMLPDAVGMLWFGLAGAAGGGVVAVLSRAR